MIQFLLSVTEMGKAENVAILDKDLITLIGGISIGLGLVVFAIAICVTLAIYRARKRKR